MPSTPMRTVFIAATLLALAGCQKEPVPTPAPEHGNQTPPSQTTAPVSSPAISVSPASMSDCIDTVASVHWDAGKAGETTNSTEIWVGTSNTDSKLFSAGGATGDTKTGAWTRPGIHFVLKNKQNGKVIGETVVGGPACK